MHKRPKKSDGVFKHTRTEEVCLNMIRRQTLKRALSVGGMLPLAALSSRVRLLSGASTAAWLFSEGRTDAFSPQNPHRFLQILLAGGWDSALATDPVRGEKIADGQRYDNAYAGVTQHLVPGKPALVVGQGLEPALPAFAALPTCFVNGLFVEVTAHELAVNYMLSGRLSLSRSREFPAVVALMGDRSGVFPPHVTLGSAVPLGTTRDLNPPLHARDVNALRAMLAGPRSKMGADDPQQSDQAVEIAHNLISTLNGLRYSQQQMQNAQNLRVWAHAEQRLGEIYGPRFDQRVGLNPGSQTRTNYGLPADGGEDTVPALLAGAVQVLSSGLSPYVTVHAGSYDTHRNHLGLHLPEMRTFATAFNRLVNDLQSTPDPSVPQMTLAQTTTILITSEFVRTPLFNAAGGTDHWQSGSAILMGKGTRDQTVIGQTDGWGRPRGWVDGQAVDFEASTRITPENLGASMLVLLGYSALAAELEASPISSLVEGT